MTISEIFGKCNNLHIQSNIKVFIYSWPFKDRLIFEGELCEFMELYKNTYLHGIVKRFCITSVELRTAEFYLH